MPERHFWRKLLLTWHTLCHLRPRQAFYYAWRRGIGLRRVARRDELAPLRGCLGGVWPASSNYGENEDIYSFTFLNETLNLPRQAMDWRPASVSRLWRYNLHYFDFLRDTQRTAIEKQALIDDWIANNPQGSQPAWEPYTASLRIVNWCRFFSAQPEHQTPHRNQSLYEQACWLERNLEHHILANHLFENIKALLFAGAFFQDDNAARWLRHGQFLLCQQLGEQMLSDGGHYERTPQYHCIVLEGCLDLIELARANSGLLTDESLRSLGNAIIPALDFLAAIRTPDNDIPLFNDSASGIASKPDAIAARACSLGFDSVPQRGGEIERDVSGLFGWKSQRDYFLIDCGDIGPAYQPGHTHCDFLSYVLMVRNRWLIVDSGVCEYEPGAMRQYTRSTLAHNTVTVDGEDQSEVWGEFRVGRRAQRNHAALSKNEKCLYFEGQFSGFPTVPGSIRHRRQIALNLSEQEISELTVTDTLEGTGAYRLDSYVHLHPALQATVDKGNISIHSGGEVVARLHTIGTDNVDVIKGWYCPEFGKKLSNTVLRLTRTGPLPIEFGYVISVTEQ